MNLLESLTACLKENGKSLDDIQWVGCKEFSIPIENFFTLAAETRETFNSDIAVDLLVVGKDFWAEREYPDCGDVVWHFQTQPKKPSKEKMIKTLTTNDLTEGEYKKAYADARNVIGYCGYMPYDELWMMLYKE